MRPALTGLFLCLGGFLCGSLFCLRGFLSRSLGSGRLGGLGLVVRDNDLKIVVRGSGLGLGGRFVFAMAANSFAFAAAVWAASTAMFFAASKFSEKRMEKLLSAA